MEMLLTGAAACTAYDVVTILRRGRHPVADVAVAVEAERAPEPPRVFTRLHFTYTVAGRGLDRKPVERAILLSKEKYCSATIMLGRTAAVTWDLVLVDGDRVPPPDAGPPEAALHPHRGPGPARGRRRRAARPSLRRGRRPAVAAAATGRGP